MEFSRREFLQLGGVLAAALGLGRYDKVMADGLEKIASQQVKVLWVSAQSCSGCSVSLLNTDSPGPLELLTEYISLVFHPVVSAAQGTTVKDIYDKMEKAGRYILVIEGSIPVKMPEACIMMGGKTLDDYLPGMIRRAEYIMAAGSCAAFGGIPAAEGNETGAVSVKDYMVLKKIPYENKLVSCPLCPTNPDSLVGTLAYFASVGYPKVDKDLLTPLMFYEHSTHDNCPRFHYYEKGFFAEKFGDDGCLFNLGCLGFLSHTECPGRQWNGGVNWCIRAGAPCIACSNQHFARYKNFPFYRKGEKYRTVAYNEKQRKGE